MDGSNEDVYTHSIICGSHFQFTESSLAEKFIILDMKYAHETTLHAYCLLKSLVRETVLQAGQK